MKNNLQNTKKNFLRYDIDVIEVILQDPIIKSISEGNTTVQTPSLVRIIPLFFKALNLNCILDDLEAGIVALLPENDKSKYKLIDNHFKNMNGLKTRRSYTPLFMLSNIQFISLNNIIISIKFLISFFCIRMHLMQRIYVLSKFCYCLNSLDAIQDHFKRNHSTTVFNYCIFFSDSNFRNTLLHQFVKSKNIETKLISCV